MSVLFNFETWVHLKVQTSKVNSGVAFPQVQAIQNVLEERSVVAFQVLIGIEMEANRVTGWDLQGENFPMTPQLAFEIPWIDFPFPRGIDEWA